MAWRCSSAALRQSDGSCIASWWTVALLTALLTLRHRITQTGANTLEAYFQPRMLAFALGAWAIAAYLRGRGAAALALVAAAFALHPTTALWFGSGLPRRWRCRNGMARAADRARRGRGDGVSVGGRSLGPLRGHLDRMDPLWASAMAGKDYIFPSDWNASFWLVNFGYLAVGPRHLCTAAPPRRRACRAKRGCWQAPPRWLGCF